MIAGWDATSNAIVLDVASRRRFCLASPKPAARGLLSLISLLSAFLLNVIKRNQVSFPFRLVLVILASHFRGRMELPKKSATWNPASMIMLSSASRRLVTWAAQRSPMCLTVTARSRLMCLCPSSGAAPNAVVRKPTTATGHFIIHHLEVSTIDRARYSRRSDIEL